MKEEPDNIPRIISRALLWLNKLNIHCYYLPESNMWEILYKSHYILMPNFVEDDEIGFVYPIFINGEDPEIRKMVYEFAFSLIEEDFDECDITLIDDELCQISQLWTVNGKKNLYKYQIIEILNHIIRLGEYFELRLTEAYEMLFNPPPEVWEEILRDIENTN